MAAALPDFNRFLHHHPRPNRCIQEEFKTSFESAADKSIYYEKGKGKRPISLSDSETDSDDDDDDMFRIEPIDIVFPKQKPIKHFDNDIFELFSVVLKGVNEDSLTGYIGVSGNFEDLYLFEREKPEDGDITVFTNKDGDKELLMNGPTCQSLLTYDPVNVNVELTDVKTNISILDNFTFESINRDFISIYNTPLSATYSRKGFGTIEFTYAVFNNAVAAKVEVKLLHQDNTKDHRVVGEIYARDSLHKIRTCLFNKETPCLVPYNDGKQQLTIPLSKSIVALPNEAGLVIELDLTDSNTGLSLVKSGVAVFPGPPQQIKMYRWSNFSLNQHVGNNILVTVSYASLYE